VCLLVCAKPLGNPLGLPSPERGHTTSTVTGLSCVLLGAQRMRRSVQRVMRGCKRVISARVGRLGLVTEVLPERDRPYTDAHLFVIIVFYIEMYVVKF